MTLHNFLRSLSRRKNNIPVPPIQVAPPRDVGGGMKDPERFLTTLRAIVNVAYMEMERLLPDLYATFPERKVAGMRAALGDLKAYLSDMLVFLHPLVELGPPDEHVSDMQGRESK